MTLYLSDREEQYVLEMSKKLDISTNSVIKLAISRFQLIEENIYTMTPNLDHPINRRMKCAPEND